MDLDYLLVIPSWKSVSKLVLFFIIMSWNLVPTLTKWICWCIGWYTCNIPYLPRYCWICTPCQTGSRCHFTRRLSSPLSLQWSLLVHTFFHLLYIPSSSKPSLFVSFLLQGCSQCCCWFCFLVLVLRWNFYHLLCVFFSSIFPFFS